MAHRQPAEQSVESTDLPPRNLPWILSQFQSSFHSFAEDESENEPRRQPPQPTDLETASLISEPSGSAVSDGSISEDEDEQSSDSIGESDEYMRSYPLRKENQAVLEQLEQRELQALKQRQLELEQAVAMYVSGKLASPNSNIAVENKSWNPNLNRNIMSRSLSRLGSNR